MISTAPIEGGYNEAMTVLLAETGLSEYSCHYTQEGCDGWAWFGVYILIFSGTVFFIVPLLVFNIIGTVSVNASALPRPLHLAWISAIWLIPAIGYLSWWFIGRPRTTLTTAEQPY